MEPRHVRIEGEGCDIWTGGRRRRVTVQAGDGVGIGGKKAAVSELMRKVGFAEGAVADVVAFVGKVEDRLGGDGEDGIKHTTLVKEDLDTNRTHRKRAVHNCFSSAPRSIKSSHHDTYSDLNKPSQDASPRQSVTLPNRLSLQYYASR